MALFDALARPWEVLARVNNFDELRLRKTNLAKVPHLLSIWLIRSTRRSKVSQIAKFVASAQAPWIMLCRSEDFVIDVTP